MMRSRAVGCVVWLMMLAGPRLAGAELLYGLTADHHLKVFAPSKPGQALSTVPITGLRLGTVLQAIDFRPVDSQLYALGAAGNDFRLYRINTATGLATLISQTPLAIPLTGELGFDFDPVSGKIRVVTSTEQNLRIDPETGQIIDSNPGTPAIDPDTPLNVDGNVVALGYTNNFHGAASTTLYGLDIGTDRLVRIGGIGGTPSPNLGAVAMAQPLGIDVVGAAGLDVSPLAAWQDSGNPEAYILYAALRVANGDVRLLRIDSGAGKVTLGILAGSGGATVRDIAVLNRSTTAYALTRAPHRLFRFKAHDPANLHSMPISADQGDTYAAIDVRPSTGELYGLSQEGNLYTIDPAIGTAARVGAPGTTLGYLDAPPGFDFDPVTDRIRVVMRTRNLTLDPVTAVATEHTNLPNLPASWRIAGLAYSNSTPNALATTLYGFISDPGLLVRLGGRDGVTPSPDEGEVTVLASSPGFGPAYLSDVSAFDIDPATNSAYLVVQSVADSFLFFLDLSTGETRMLGRFPVSSDITGLALAMPGQVRFAAGQITIAENGGQVQLQITRVGGSDGPITIDYATVPSGSAAPGEDYIHTSGTLIFLDKETTKTIAIPILNDAFAEGAVEELTVRLDAPTLGTSVAGSGIATIRITDDDVAPPTPSTPPTITITTPTSESATVVSSSFVDLAGTASDDTGAVSVTWSDSAGQSGSAQIERTGTTTSWLIPAIPLREDTTTITVKARDESGAEGIDTLVVARGTSVFLLAEGATGAFFDLDILLANPEAAPVDVQITFLKEDGSRVQNARTLPALSRTTIRVDDIPGMEETSAATEVRSSRPIIVERTMRWDDATGYGAHTEKAVEAAALKWYFAEGSQGFFSTYLLFANPTDTMNSATVEYLREGAPPIVRTYPLGPYARFTMDASADVELVDRSFGMVVTFAAPAVAERAMYFGTDPLWKAGHESAGVTVPSTTWFLAEGATGPFFETFILLANPQTTPAEVTMTYLLQGGAPVTKTYTVAPSARLTINIEHEDPALANVAVGTQVVATVPIVVERAQYWPYAPDQWYEAHNSFGVIATGRHWGLAEGRTGGPLAYETYILLANPGTTDAQVTLTCLRTSGAPLTKTFTVPPASRLNVATGTGGPLAELVDEEFSAVISSTEPIAVERAMYSTAGGLTWSAGTNATATRIQPVP
jgi:hypothetical protein